MNMGPCPNTQKSSSLNLYICPVATVDSGNIHSLDHGCIDDLETGYSSDKLRGSFD